MTVLGTMCATSSIVTLNGGIHALLAFNCMLNHVEKLLCKLNSLQGAYLVPAHIIDAHEDQETAAQELQTKGKKGRHLPVSL